VSLIPPFYEVVQRSSGQIQRAALVVDARDRNFLYQFPDMLQGMRARKIPAQLLFFECSDEVLVRRFSESRRPHPMAGAGETLKHAIEAERSAMTPLRGIADRVIDTSNFTSHELRSLLKSSYGSTAGEQGLNVHVLSFGFKYGVPSDADLVFDVRFLPNPYFVEELRPLDGRSTEVRQFLDRVDVLPQFLQRAEEMLKFLVPLYAAEGKSYLTLALGCTGGKHRSVALAERVSTLLEPLAAHVTVSHRDLGKE
jgi:UPF0042 nucleotide-binding protein